MEAPSSLPPVSPLPSLTFPFAPGAPTFLPPSWGLPSLPPAPSFTSPGLSAMGLAVAGPSFQAVMPPSPPLLTPVANTLTNISNSYAGPFISNPDLQGNIQAVLGAGLTAGSQSLQYLSMSPQWQQALANGGPWATYLGGGLNILTSASGILSSNSSASWGNMGNSVGGFAGSLLCRRYGVWRRNSCYWNCRRGRGGNWPGAGRIGSGAWRLISAGCGSCGSGYWISCLARSWLLWEA